MEIMFAGIFGVVIGLAGLLLARPREAIGEYFLPALGGALALVLWAVATWLSTVRGFAWLAYDAFWVWVLVLGITGAVVLIVALTVPRRRAETDRDLLDRLSHLGRAAI